MKENFEVRDRQIEGILKEMGYLLAGRIPDGWGFAFEMFEFGTSGGFFYISNAKREDLIKALEETIVNLKKEDVSR